MPDRARRSAQEDFIKAMQGAIRCFVDVWLYAAPTDRGDIIALAHRPGLAQHPGDPGLLGSVVHYVRMEKRAEAGWAAITVGYSYAAWKQTERSERPKELFRYDYHPLTTPDVTFPHLHVHAESPAMRTSLARVHFRTGAVTIADFFRVLMRDFGVVPSSHSPQCLHFLASA